MCFASLLLACSFRAIAPDTSAACCAAPAPPVRAPDAPVTDVAAVSLQNMVYIPEGDFEMGALPDDPDARADEKPRHRVHLHGYWIDSTEVTNSMFAAFVKATGYRTTAERPISWDQLRQQLPAGTPKPPPEQLQPGSLVFRPPDHDVPMTDPSALWIFLPGADWRHPQGPDSDIRGMDSHPVVHVSFEDACAYAAWAGKRLPSEAEWECAARTKPGTIFAWGNQPIDKARANTWQGAFPRTNTCADGFAFTAPVRSFPPTPSGIYDMAGNVWEWCADWYRPDSYTPDAAHPLTSNPSGPPSSLDPVEPTVPKRVLRGGSFLCAPAYCTGYRISARMKCSPDSSLVHTGFRCVADAPAPKAPQ